MKHNDYTKIYLHHSLSSFGSLTVQIAYVSTETFIPTNRDWFTSVLDPTFEFGFSVAYLFPDRSTHRGTRDLSDPFVKDRHTFQQAFTDICVAPRS